MPSVPNIEFQNSRREDGGPWAALLPLNKEGMHATASDEVHSVQVYYSDSEIPPDVAVGGDPWIHVLTITADEIEIIPVQQRYGHETYGRPLFKNIRRLVLMSRVNWPYDLPQTIEDLDGLLEELPDGFYKNWRHGLGVKWDYRVILSAIDSVPGISTVVFHGPPRPPRADHLFAPCYAICMETFNQLRRDVRLISGRHQRAARREKEVLCHNVLLHGLQPKRFERKRVRLAPNALAELTNQSHGHVTLSKRDQRAAVALVRRNAESLSKAEPAELLRLKDDIEAVSLQQLIEKCEALLSPPANETRWQAFFKTNPFVLTMAFHFPVVMIADVPYVGGKAHHGTGGKFSDFLMAAATTNNLAIVEIKSPRADLLASEYRQGIWPASKDLSGAVAQAIAQRDTFQENFAFTGRELDRQGYRAYSLACVVIAGMTPDRDEKRQAFERYRHSLHGITIVTFDELLERLRSIYKLLTDAPPLPQAPTAPWAAQAPVDRDGPSSFGDL